MTADFPCRNFTRRVHDRVGLTRIGAVDAKPEEPAEHDVAYRTHFERRMRLYDSPVYRAEFRKPPEKVTNVRDS